MTLGWSPCAHKYGFLRVAAGYITNGSAAIVLFLPYVISKHRVSYYLVKYNVAVVIVAVAVVVVVVVVIAVVTLYE